MLLGKIKDSLQRLSRVFFGKVKKKKEIVTLILKSLEK